MVHITSPRAVTALRLTNGTMYLTQNGHAYYPSLREDPYKDALWRKEGDTVPIDANYALATVWVLYKESDGSRKPAGTGFLLDVQERFGGPVFRYLVTCRHVARACEDNAWVRLRTADVDVVQTPPSGTEDVSLGRWYYHPEDDVGADVAVARVNIPRTPSQDQKRWANGFIRFRLDVKERKVGPKHIGDSVYYVGLLGNVPEMKERAQPMVRSGTLGAWNQENVPVEVVPDIVMHVTAHLIDCRSVSGFSGSPCIVHWEDWVEELPEGQKVVRSAREGEKESYLFGMLLGHLPDIKSGENAGVGVVIPVERIRETLMREDLVEHRRKDEQALEENDGEDGAAKGAALLDSLEGDRDRPGPEPERLDAEGPWEDVARRVMDAGKPGEEED